MERLGKIVRGIIARLRGPSPSLSRRWLIIAKIMAKVVVTPEGCYLWQGGNSGTGRGGGYPRMKLDGGTVAVHIAMWVCEHGPIPPRKQLDHTCNQRMCVNPAHLEMVTHKENQRRRDMRRAATQLNKKTFKEAA